MNRPNDHQYSLPRLSSDGGGCKKIYLLSSVSQLRDLNPNDPDLLVLTTEWPVWREWRDRKGRSEHTDQYLMDWDGDDFGTPAQIYHTACDWMYFDDHDDSYFQGISLGHQFDSEIATADLMLRKLQYALEEAFRKHNPEIIVLRDIRAYNSIIDDEIKSALVKYLCETGGIEYIDELAAFDPNGDDFQDAVLFSASPVKENSFKKLLRQVFFRCIESLFILRWFVTGRRPKIFMVLSELAFKGYIHTGRRAKFTPVFVGERSEKNFRFYKNCWRIGAIPAFFPDPGLSGSEEKEIASIITRIEGKWQQDQVKTPREFARRHYVQNRLFDSGKFRAMAVFAKRNITLFDRHKFVHVMICDVRTGISRIPAEIAKQQGLKVDELLNGIFVTPLRDISRCGDRLNQPLVDRNLAWGAAFRDWFENITGQPGAEIGGNPVIDCFHPSLALSNFSSETTKEPGKIKVLVLTVYSGIADAKALRSNTTVYALETVSTLLEQGYDVRLKVHPSVDNAEYFRRLFEMYGLNCPVYGKNSPYVEAANWADVVISPVSSGAYAETMAYGKPIIGMVPHHSSIELDYFKGALIIRHPRDLAKVLQPPILKESLNFMAQMCATDPDGISSNLFVEILEKAVQARS